MKSLLLVIVLSASAQAADLDTKTQDDLIQVARLCKILLETSLSAERPYEMTESENALSFVKRVLESAQSQEEK